MTPLHLLLAILGLAVGSALGWVVWAVTQRIGPDRVTSVSFVAWAGSLALMVATTLFGSTEIAGRLLLLFLLVCGTSLILAGTYLLGSITESAMVVVSERFRPRSGVGSHAGGFPDTRAFEPSPRPGNQVSPAARR